MGAVPQVLPAQAVACGMGLQTQTLVALHIWDGVQEPQEYIPPQPFGTLPQFLPRQAVAIGVGVQPQTFVALQIWGAVQVPQV